MKIQEIIDTIETQTNVYDRISKHTIDQLIIGDSSQECHGIITTFMATVSVIREAIAQHANFIVTHEPTWFSDHDQTDWLQDDSVYQEKRQLIEAHHLVIYRFHDHMHFGGDHDLIMRGVAEQLGWQHYLLPGQADGANVLEQSETRFDIPESPLNKVLAHIAQRLDLHGVRYIGDLATPVQHVAALVGGASLGLGEERNPAQQVKDQNIDLVICGDITEWTLSAYIRDANQLGKSVAMVVIGHERSEEFGMKWLAGWLQAQTQVATTWIDAKDPFKRLLYDPQESKV